MKWLTLLLLSTMAFAAGGACPTGASYVDPSNPTGPLKTLAQLGVTSCYYFSKSTGLDSNAGTSEASPQKNLPCMPSYTGSQAPFNSGIAGTGFIMRGGETWGNADLECGWWGGGPNGAFNNWGGSAGNPVYIGVDLTWFNSTACGGAWCRPTWTCGNATCTELANGDGYYKDTSSTQYVILDNVEMTGLEQTASDAPGYVKIFGNNNTVTRVYTHGWGRNCSTCGDQTTAFSPSQCCGGGFNNNFYFDIVDGSDTGTSNMLDAFSGDPNIVAYSYMSNVTNGMQGSVNQVHDTFIGNMPVSFSAGAHQNAIQQCGPVQTASGVNAPANFFYNNVITGVSNGGITKLWLQQCGSNTTAFTTYAFDNVLFANAAGNDVNPGQLGTNSGTVIHFNNTYECGSVATGVGPCMGGSGLTVLETIHFINNHCIASACLSLSGSNFTFDETTDLVQSLAAASSQGYTEGSTYAMQPTIANGGTVAAGTNKESLCTTINGIDSTAGAACLKDTGYSCTYNTSNHTLSCPARAQLTRPTSTAWDIGAYQFTGAPPPVTHAHAPGMFAYDLSGPTIP